MTTTTATLLTLGELADVVEEVNRANGWFDDDRTVGDDLALLHSEVSEALEAYRDHGADDVTAVLVGHAAEYPAHPDDREPLPKPEGLGSELADILVRLLDTYSRRRHLARPGWWVAHIADLDGHYVHGQSIGDQLAYLHKLIAEMRLDAVAPYVAALARFYGLDLTAEFDRKVAYNRTRGHRHGGKRL